MLVHIKLLTDLDEFNDWDYDKTKTIGFETIENIDKFVELIHSLKKNENPLVIDKDWYTIEDCALSFPKDSETVPCFYVYVTEYC